MFDGYLRSYTLRACSQVEETETSLTVFPQTNGIKPAINNGVAIDTYNDHRMAMAFSLISCAPAQVTINDPACVRKTYPAFFKVFDALATYSNPKDKKSVEWRLPNIGTLGDWESFKSMYEC